MDIIKRLESLGFSTYEAKAYYALLQKKPANGYEISKVSQVPPSKIYETLQKLKNRGAVLDSQTDPVMYLPVEPQVLFSRMQSEKEAVIQSVIEDLEAVKPVDSFELTWNLKGTSTINERIIEIIQRAKRNIYLSVWPEQASCLNAALAAAMQRGVYVVAATFGQCSLPAQQIINLEACAVKVSSRAGARLCTAAGDNEEVVIGELSDNEENSKGVWTKTASVILIAKEYIKHDIMVNLLVNHIGAAQYQALFEENPLIARMRAEK